MVFLFLFGDRVLLFREVEVGEIFFCKIWIFLLFYLIMFFVFLGCLVFFGFNEVFCKGCSFWVCFLCLRFKEIDLLLINVDKILWFMVVDSVVMFFCVLWEDVSFRSCLMDCGILFLLEMRNLWRLFNMIVKEMFFWERILRRDEKDWKKRYMWSCFWKW